MENLDMGVRIRRVDGSAGQALGDQFLVLDLSSGDYYDLGATGGFIWERLDGVKPLGALAAELAQTYGLETKRARVDLTAFVRNLLQRGLAEVVETASS